MESAQASVSLAAEAQGDAMTAPATPGERGAREAEATRTVARALLGECWLAEHLDTPQKLRDHYIEYGKQECAASSQGREREESMRRITFEPDGDDGYRVVSAPPAQPSEEGVGLGFAVWENGSPTLYEDDEESGAFVHALREDAEAVRDKLARVYSASEWEVVEVRRLAAAPRRES